MDQSEVEDIIPFSIIEKKVHNLLMIDDDEEEFELESGKPIISQIENYAKGNSIELPKGWKVELARAFNRRIYGKKKVSIPEENMKMWQMMFKKLL